MFGLFLVVGFCGLHYDDLDETLQAVTVPGWISRSPWLLKHVERGVRDLA